MFKKMKQRAKEKVIKWIRKNTGIVDLEVEANEFERRLSDLEVRVEE